MTDKYLEQIDSGIVLDKSEEISKQEDIVKMAQESVSFLEQEFVLTQEVQGIILDNMKLIKATHEYQKIDKYWELQRELSVIQFLKTNNTKKIELERSKEIANKEAEKLANLKGE